MYIEQKAEQQLSAYLRLAKGEISGFGVVERREDYLVVTDIFILPQEAGNAHTELDTDALQDLLYGLLRDGKDPATIGLWWHSHSNFGAFFSSTDDDTIERFAELGSPWMLSLVSNHQLEHNLRLDFYEPLRATVENLTLQKSEAVDEKFDRRIAQEIEAKVRPSPPTVVQQHGENGNSINDDIIKMLLEQGAVSLEEVC